MTSRTLRMTVLALLTTLSAAQALAGSHPLVERRFKAADTNGDGKLTLSEAKAGMPKVAAIFDKIDTEKKGYITLTQLEAYVDLHQQDQQ